MTTKNGNRVTIRDVMTAVQGLHERIDHTNTRIDGLTTEQAQTSRQMASLETCVKETIDDLRGAVNERLHAVEADVVAVRRPWVFIRSGWTKASAAAAAASAATALLSRFVDLPLPF